MSVRDAAVGHHVLALLHRHRRHRGHRLDAFDIDLLQLLDERQDGVELALEVLDLIVRDRDARQMRDAADGCGIDGHGGSSQDQREPIAKPRAARQAMRSGKCEKILPKQEATPRARAAAPAPRRRASRSIRAPAWRGRAKPPGPTTAEEKSPEPCACAFACSGASAPPASGNSGATSLTGPISRITRLMTPRAGRPVIRLVIAVPSSRAAFSAARCGGKDDRLRTEHVGGADLHARWRRARTPPRSRARP